MRSPCSVRSVATFAVFCVASWRGWVALEGHVRSHFDIPADDVPLRLLNMQFALYGLSFPVMVTFILETRQNAEYAARWHEFQVGTGRCCSGRSASTPTALCSQLASSTFPPR